jgi:hypothetical protein
LAIPDLDRDAAILTDQKMRCMTAVAPIAHMLAEMTATNKRLQGVQAMYQALFT